MFIVNIARKSFVSLCFLIASPWPLHAASMNVEADHATFDHLSGHIHYEGHIHIQQDHVEIQGDHMTALENQAGNIEQVRVLGSPAQYLSHDANQVHALSKEILMYPKKALTIFLGDAEATRGGTRLLAEKICFDRKANQIQTDHSARGRSTLFFDTLPNGSPP